VSFSSKNKEKIMKYTKEQHYTITVACSNCGHHGNLTIKKGCYVTDESCPKCGCKNLRRDPKPTF
jgi:predicted nucleic-acid-binding Zn-ribbon protein